ncbi:RNA polymerase subunit sigma [Vibrio albus]|uniref:RNA polymerase subunit sigma n=1 Tax=Vibrio albus TaxID=2200953 RepID=A0A2U3B848_9VIBR|nr:ECF-type sigma factor [Vibrio albus]PWI32976.1 RNA polymerase subunit sigma [Vibrio albus]
MAIQGNSSELTQIIHGWQQGDKQAEQQLYLFAYQKLRDIAQRERKRSAEKFGTNNDVLLNSANNTTALIHEAYIKLSSSGLDLVKNRRQFYLMAAKVMRQILIDNARAMQAQKRQPVNEIQNEEMIYIDQLLSIEKALDNFSVRYPRQSDVIKLKYFMGLSNKEISSLMDCSNSLIEKDLKFSRSWLRTRVM